MTGLGKHHEVTFQKFHTQVTNVSFQAATMQHVEKSEYRGIIILIYFLNFLYTNLPINDFLKYCEMLQARKQHLSNPVQKHLVNHVTEYTSNVFDHLFDRYRLVAHTYMYVKRNLELSTAFGYIIKMLSSNELAIYSLVSVISFNYIYKPC